MPEIITKRLLWKVSMTLFDPLGLALVFLIKLKLLMRELSSEAGQVTDWDSPVPDVIKEEFIKIIKEIKDLRDVSFKRSIKPTNWKRGTLHSLLVFADGSLQAICCLAYARWPTEDWRVVCILISGKTNTNNIL
jgi:hypothetical protein